MESYKKKMKGIDVVMSILDRIRQRNEEGESNSGMKKRIIFILSVMVTVFVVINMFFSVYILDPAERGVETTWGAVTDVTGEGVHFVWPFIQDVHVINVEQINRETFGYSDEDEQKDIRMESYKVTKDGKVVNVFYVVQYKITDPVSWVINPPKKSEIRRQVIRDIMESNMSDIVNNKTVDDVWTTGKEQIQNEARIKMQEMFDSMKFGITIQQIVIQETETPNEQVNEAFRDVNSALSERDSKILVAKKEASKTITQTDGEIATILNKARSIADSKLYTVKGECDRINALSAQYNANPNLTKKTLYLEMVKQFLQKYGSNLVLIEGENNINVLPINELFKK